MKTIFSPHAPAAIGPYAQAIEAGGFLFISGQLPINPKSGKIEASSIEGQTEQVLLNLEAILEAAGLSLAHVVRSEIYLMDLQDFATVNSVYGKRFTQHKPARQTLQVAGIPLGARVEISMIASLQK